MSFHEQRGHFKRQVARRIRGVKGASGDNWVAQYNPLNPGILEPFLLMAIKKVMRIIIIANDSAQEGKPFS
jgi:hypothetical protein